MVGVAAADEGHVMCSSQPHGTARTWGRPVAALISLTRCLSMALMRGRSILPRLIIAAIIALVSIVSLGCSPGTSSNPLDANNSPMALRRGTGAWHIAQLALYFLANAGIAWAGAALSARMRPASAAERTRKGKSPLERSRSWCFRSEYAGTAAPAQAGILPFNSRAKAYR